MTTKKIVTAILLLFVAVAIGTVAMRGIYSDSKNTSAGMTAQSTQNPQQAALPENSVETVPSNASINADANVDIVYYFMTSQRCQTCMKFEAYTWDTMEKHFGDALDKGELAWKMVRVDTAENNHYIKDYGLITKSVVLVKIRDGKQVKWKNLERIWTLAGDRDAFVSYIETEVREFVGKG